MKWKELLMKPFRPFLTLLILVVISSTFCNAAHLDSLLKVQRVRAGKFADALFAPLDASNPERLTSSEKEDYRFLLAYLPLSDLASITAQELISNIRLAQQARREFSWGNQYDESTYRHFVLPHRISQEPYVHGWREKFFRELKPRIQHLSMSEAALEVNHWCLEYVTFVQTDARDQDPFTTIRSGFGRCEEEMIFTIAALRSVGIPARQCFTPYWATTDNNHAWVEAWADGKWNYYGACEPEPILNQGWFTERVARAFLVLSSAYGDYEGNEPIYKRNITSTYINSTAVYGKTRNLHITLVNEEGEPLPKKTVVLSIINYGGLMPVASVITNDSGKAEITCGYGDCWVSSGDQKNSVFQFIKGNETQVTLFLHPTPKLMEAQHFLYEPPPNPTELKTVEKDSLFRCRMSEADTLRKNRVWTMWAVEQGIQLSSKDPIQPDSLFFSTFILATEKQKDQYQRFQELLRKSYGNWGNLFRYVFGFYPLYEEIKRKSKNPKQPQVYLPPLEEPMLLLESLSEKDLRDFTVAMLQDHSVRLEALTEWKKYCPDGSQPDSNAAQRIVDAVISPRIDFEPSSAWRGELEHLLRTHPELKQTKTLIKWIKKEFVIDKTLDRLAAPLTPIQVLHLKRGSPRDLERLLVAIKRTQFEAARFHPVTDQLQIWEKSQWRTIELFPTKTTPKKFRIGTVQLSVASDSVSQHAKYFQEWMISRWFYERTQPMQFEFHQEAKLFTQPLDLPEGLYVLSYGLRKPDGAVPVSLVWFEVNRKRPTKLLLDLTKHE
ncbi:MAG: transglutaminase-like domain-containing protein [bacterium]|nr:transglutaminase-like domain-containing protein [bacterium]